MIKSFVHKGLEDFFYEGEKKGIRQNHEKKLAAIMDRLDAANEIRDMNYPGSYLHLLEPRANNIWSVKVSGNWRVTFRFIEGTAFEINYVDYH